MRKIIVEVGQKVYFDPFADVHNAYGVDFLRGGVTEGTVDFINHKGRWFSVVYGKLRTSFFFSEIGKKVFHDRNLLSSARYNPCKGCPDRYPGRSGKCKKPEFLEWKQEQEIIRQNRKRYNTPIWQHGDRDPRRK